jgi:quinol monooxygenase YgiN
MIVGRIIMNVFPEKQKEVLQTLLLLIEPFGKENGCLSYGIFYDTVNQNIFNLISEWETRRHLTHHMRSDKFSVLLGTKSLLREPLDIKIFTVLNEEGIEAAYFIKNKLKPIDSI